MDAPKSEPQGKVEEPQKTEVVPEPSKTEPEPSAKPETFTREDVDKLLRASQGTKDKEIAALTKQVGTIAGLEEGLKTANAALGAIQQERDAQELAAAESDPDLLAQVKKRQALTAQIREDAARKAVQDAEIRDNDALLVAVNEAKHLEHAKALAKEFGLPEETILGFGAETPEELRKMTESVSKVLKGQSPDGKLPRPENPVGATPPNRDLSGKTPLDLATMGYAEKGASK